MLKTGTVAWAASSAHRLVRPGPDSDRGHVARQHVGGVAQRLAPAELHLVGAQHHRVAAELEHPGLERHPRAGRRRLEDQRDRLARQRLRGERRALELGRPSEQRRRARRTSARLRSGSGAASAAVYVATIVMRLRVLTWNLMHGRAQPSAGRDLRREFTAALAGWEWDVALLQEVPPWWPARLGAELAAEYRFVLTSRNGLLAARRAIADPLAGPDQLQRWWRKRDPRPPRPDRRPPHAAARALPRAPLGPRGVARRPGSGSSTSTRPATRFARSATASSSRGPRCSGRPARRSWSAVTSTCASPLQWSATRRRTRRRPHLRRRRCADRRSGRGARSWHAVRSSTAGRDGRALGASRRPALRRAPRAGRSRAASAAPCRRAFRGPGARRAGSRRRRRRRSHGPAAAVRAEARSRRRSARRRTDWSPGVPRTARGWCRAACTARRRTGRRRGARRCARGARRESPPTADAANSPSSSSPEIGVGGERILVLDPGRADVRERTRILARPGLLPAVDQLVDRHCGVGRAPSCASRSGIPASGVDACA